MTGRDNASKRTAGELSLILEKRFSGVSLKNKKEAAPFSLHCSEEKLLVLSQTLSGRGENYFPYLFECVSTASFGFPKLEKIISYESSSLFKEVLYLLDFLWATGLRE